MAGIQRYCESGAKVPDWNTVGVVSGLWISYLRKPPLVPATIEWLVRSVVCVLKWRYTRRYINRSPRDSSGSLPNVGCFTQRLRNWVLHKGVNAATGILVGPVKVVFAGVVKSTWNLYM